MDINQRIKQLRTTLKFTLRTFSDQINIDNSTLSLIENGKRNATDRTIADICREFKTNEAWLRTGEGNMFVEQEQDDLDKLFDTLGADALDRQLFMSYFTLSVDERATIKKWLSMASDNTANN